MTSKKAVFICDICQSGTCSLSLNECGNNPAVCPFDDTYQADWVKQEPPVIKDCFIAENPDVDAMLVADKIRAVCFDETMGYDSYMAESLIKEYAEAYHAKKCAECERVKRKQYHPMGTEQIDKQCLTCELQCPSGCPLD